MSNIEFSFDPSVSSSNQFPAPNSAANGNIVFWNESNISIDLSFQDGTTLYLPAWYHRHKMGFTGNVNVQWAVRAVLNSGTVPLSEVVVESYDEFEDYPPDGPLVRQANGETNATQVGSTLVNTGNVPGTPNIIEIGNTGVGGTNITTLNNSGNFVNGNAAYPGTVSLDNSLITTDGAGHLTLSYNTPLQIKDSGGTPQSILYVNSSNTILQSPTSSGPIQFKSNVGTFWCQVSPNGYAGPTGDNLCRVGSASGTGSGTVSHTLGATPDFMAMSIHVAGSTTTYSYSGETSTQVSVTLNNSLSWFGFLTKRS